MMTTHNIYVECTSNNFACTSNKKIQLMMLSHKQVGCGMNNLSGSCINEVLIFTGLYDDVENIEMERHIVALPTSVSRLLK